MAKESVATKIENLLIPLCEKQDVLLYDLFFEAGGRNLRVFIDTKTKGETVLVEHCEKISRALSDILDEEDIVPGDDYTLEVSSPGVERKLTKPWHYISVVGTKIEIKLFEALGKMYPDVEKKYQRVKSIQGLVAEATEDGFTLDVDGNGYRFSYDKVVKANVVFEF